ncbi:MAG: hypothetical protein R2688_04280 [Fimbriimonadaceae bacterium]
MSGAESAILAFNSRCAEVLSKHGASEFKWNRISSRETSAAAHEMLELLFSQNQIRVLTLSWDIKGPRYNGLPVNDSEDFHRMLFHGLRRNADWHRLKDWHWFPDQKTDLREEHVQSVLNTTKEQSWYLKNPTLLDTERLRLNFGTPKQKCSKEVPIIGVADIFAGAMRESLLNAEKILHTSKMLDASSRQNLFEEGELELLIDEENEISKSEQSRLDVCARIYLLGERYKQGVSLRSKMYFHSHNEKTNFLFWHWVPQGRHDKAPLRKKPYVK